MYGTFDSSRNETLTAYFHQTYNIGKVTGKTDFRDQIAQSIENQYFIVDRRGPNPVMIPTAEDYTTTSAAAICHMEE